LLLVPSLALKPPPTDSHRSRGDDIEAAELAKAIELSLMPTTAQTTLRRHAGLALTERLLSGSPPPSLYGRCRLHPWGRRRKAAAVVAAAAA
jgi:hypothetical protein